MNSDRINRISFYYQGLLQMWRDEPNTETRNRFTGFTGMDHTKRLKWIDWVEARGDKIEWCGRLIAIAVAERLTK